MLCLIDRTFSDNDICFSVQNRAYNLFNILTAILIISIRIYDDICSVSEARIQSCHKSFCKTFVLFEIDNVVHAPVLCDFYGIVLTSVIDDQIFDLVNAIDVLWQIVQCDF